MGHSRCRPRTGFQKNQTNTSMNTAIKLPPTPTARQPILAFHPTPTRRETTPAPMHDFLVLSPCPDFTPELPTAGTINHRERAPQRCA